MMVGEKSIDEIEPFLKESLMIRERYWPGTISEAASCHLYAKTLSAYEKNLELAIKLEKKAHSIFSKLQPSGVNVSSTAYILGWLYVQTSADDEDLEFGIENLEEAKRIRIEHRGDPLHSWMEDVYLKLGLAYEKTSEQIIPAISVSIGKKNEILFSNCYGSIYETQSKITNQSRFDIASMTKIITGICFMQLIEEDLITLSDSISEIFSELNTNKEIENNGKVVGWCNAGEITWVQALTHTTGMGWTRPKTHPSLPNLDKGLQDIFSLPFAYMPGEHVVYSDLPIILMGKAIERITGKMLDTVVEEKVCNPMKLQHTGYLRISGNSVKKENIIPTENDTVFRKRRIWGEVHDENAYLLDGVSGHAGIFSTSEDICRLLMKYALCRKTDGILKKDTVENMIAEHAEEDGDRRGLLWQLSGSGEKAYTKLLSPNAYGHAGFTGCFGWNDPEKDLTIVLLSNDVYNGRENRKLFEYRPQIMKMILDV